MPVSASVLSAQDIHRLPSGNVPVVIKPDSSGHVRVRVRGFLGRFKVAFLRYLGRPTRESQVTHTQFRQFLQHHYGEHLADAALQHNAAEQGSRRRELTSRQARSALNYAQSQRINHLKHNRALAHYLLHEDPMTWKSLKNSSNYEFFKNACAALEPSVDVNQLTSEQLQYARRGLVRYLNVASQHGKNPMNEEQAKQLGVHMLEQAHALGKEGCQRVSQTQQDVREAMATFFAARVQGDNSDVVRQLLRISQTMHKLQNAETSAKAPQAEAYIKGIYGSDTLMESMTSYLENNINSNESLLKFQSILSSFARDGLAVGLRTAFDAQRSTGGFSGNTGLHLERAIKMTEHLQRQWGSYGEAGPALREGVDSSYKDLTEQMRAWGATKSSTQHQAKVHMAQRALQQAHNALQKGQPLPSLLAISKVAAGDNVNRSSLNFMREALESALETDENVQSLREQCATYETLKDKDMTTSSQTEQNQHAQTLQMLKGDISRLRQKVFGRNSEYTQLHSAMSRINETMQKQSTSAWQTAAWPSGDWHEKEKYQQGLQHMLERYAPENVESVPQGSRLDWDDDGKPYLIRELMPRWHDDAKTRQTTPSPLEREAEWQVGGENRGVAENFADSVLQANLVMDDGKDNVGMRSWLRENHKYDATVHTSAVDAGIMQTHAVKKFQDFVGNPEHASFLSQLIPDTVAVGVSQQVQLATGVADSLLTHSPLTLTSRNESSSTTLQKQSDGGFIIEKQSGYASDALNSASDEQAQATPLQPSSNWSLSSRIYISPQDLQNRTFSVAVPNMSVTLKL